MSTSRELTDPANGQQVNLGYMLQLPQNNQTNNALKEV